MDFEGLVHSDTVFTLDEIVEALKTAFKEHCDTEVVEEVYLRMLAETMLNFFGYTSRVLDNMLQPEEREVFYTLEDMGLLRTEREETSLYDGREWRINYWVLNTEVILEYLNGERGVERPREMDPSEIYFTLPEELWERMGEDKTLSFDGEHNLRESPPGGLSPQLDRLLKNFKK